MAKRVPCECCGYFTLREDPIGDICHVCHWEVDGFGDPDKIRPANHMTLNEARANFRAFGAVDRRFIESVRKPKDTELPERNQ